MTEVAQQPSLSKTHETESPDDKAKREQVEQDNQLADRISSCVESSLDKIKPILKLITSHVDKADRTPKDELNEEELVKQVRPLLEEGGKILQETNGSIRGLDPDGRIQSNAKAKAAGKEASPEEYRLAELLKELTGDVTETIDDAKRKVEDMPHAKKELNPMWGLLAGMVELLQSINVYIAVTTMKMKQRKWEALRVFTSTSSGFCRSYRTPLSLS